ncbi:MAG TPA: hypothetical protein VKF42_05675, partial [Chitinivibrionales bacterium]|nr:hypothetical protein [Chitinivibrionales bacterium]
KRGTTIGGEIIAAATGVATRDWLHGYHAADTYLASLLVGNLLLDARLLDNVKAYGNGEVDYSPSADTVGVSLRELFMDANINRKVYFRAGKQVLQWGRCYLWNPTDLINVEKKPFIDKIGSREGTYGVRVHAPFGTKMNLYSFVNLNSVDRVDKTAAALKFEFLAGGTEMAFSLWGKENRTPVAGYDFSTQAFNINFYGEATISNGNNTPKMREFNGVLYIDTVSYGWTPCVSLGFNRLFDFFDIKDGITVGAEVFYDGGGYSGNVFADNQTFLYRDSVMVVVPNLAPVKVGSGDKKTFLLYNGLYEPNYHSRYYAAVFTGINRFLLSDLTFNLNALANFEQRCGIVSGSFSYTTLSNLTFGVTVDGYLGAANTEYTFWGGACDARLSVGVRF